MSFCPVVTRRDKPGPRLQSASAMTQRIIRMIDGRIEDIDTWAHSAVFCCHWRLLALQYTKMYYMCFFLHGSGTLLIKSYQYKGYSNLTALALCSRLPHCACSCRRAPTNSHIVVFFSHSIDHINRACEHWLEGLTFKLKTLGRLMFHVSRVRAARPMHICCQLVWANTHACRRMSVCLSS
jgi:hypothetical protein